MFFLCSKGVEYAENICGRSRGAGLNRAFCRDDRGVGAAAPPIISRARLSDEGSARENGDVFPWLAVWRGQ